MYSMEHANKGSWALRQIKGSVKPLSLRFIGEVRLISVERYITGIWTCREKDLKVPLIK